MIYVIEASTDLTHWFPVSTNSDRPAKRVITLSRAETISCYRAARAPSLYWLAIAAKQDVMLKGTNICFDSYDSSDPTHDDPLDPNEVKAGGSVATTEGVIDIGNATIKGKLLVVPAGYYVIGPQGSVGDLEWHVGGAIQPGCVANEFYCESSRR